MAWTVVVDDLFVRANTIAGAAGSTTGVGNGWTDVAGGVYQIASNALLATTSNTNGYRTDPLFRPLAEALVSQRLTATLAVPPTAASSVVLRGQAADTYYLAAFIPPATAQVFAIAGGTVTSLGSVAIAPAPVAGHAYTLDFSALGASPTALAFTITDVSTAGVVATLSFSDSTASLQSAGRSGVLAWSPSGTTTAQFTEVATYTQSVAAGSITVSPTALTAGTSGQVVAITGAGVTLVGATFTLSGGLGAAITAQSVTSATVASVTINPGAVGGGGAVTIISSASGTASLAVNPPNLGSLNIGFVGDSITAGTNGAPVAAMTAYLSAQGYTVTATNRAISGTSTADWLPGGANLPGAITAFQAAGVTIVQVMLATNDWRIGITVAQHAANMRLIVAALRAAGLKVLLTKSLWAVPNGVVGGYVVPPDHNDRTIAAWQTNVALCNGVNVFAGDTTGYEWSMLAPSVLDGFGLHPKDAATNAQLGQYWAVSFMGRYGAVSGGVLNRWTH